MPTEFCPQCSEPRITDMRYCRKCQFDFMPQEVAAQPAGSLGVTTEPPAAAAQTKRKHGRLTAVLGVTAVIMLLALVGSSKPADTLGGATSLGPITYSPTVKITYKLVGSGTEGAVRGAAPTSADITYTDGSGNIQQATGVSVPLISTHNFPGISFTVDHGTFVQFSAQNNGADGDLTCSIEADGAVINTGRSQGGYANRQLFSSSPVSIAGFVTW